MATLLIVDDHAAVRAGLEALVTPDPRLAVAGSVADAETALAFVQQQIPDIALIDHHLPYSAFADNLLDAHTLTDQQHRSPTR